MPDEPLIDLRKHFGIWERCGESSFWKEMGLPEYRHIFVNPVDGIMITGQDLMDPGRLAMNVFIHDASELDHEDIMPALEANYPWVKRVMMDFFVGLMLIRTGLMQITPLDFFVKYYKDQTKRYVETGKGHSEQTGKDELLEAMKRTIGALEGKALKLKKTILKADLDEFLADQAVHCS